MVSGLWPLVSGLVADTAVGAEVRVCERMCLSRRVVSSYRRAVSSCRSASPVLRSWRPVRPAASSSVSGRRGPAGIGASSSPSRSDAHASTVLGRRRWCAFLHADVWRTRRKLGCARWRPILGRCANPAGSTSARFRGRRMCARAAGAMPVTLAPPARCQPVGPGTTGNQPAGLRLLRRTTRAVPSALGGAADRADRAGRLLRWTATAGASRPPRASGSSAGAAADRPRFRRTSRRCCPRCARRRVRSPRSVSRGEDGSPHGRFAPACPDARELVALPLATR